MKESLAWEFPGIQVVGTLSSHCRGPGFDPCSGNWGPAGRAAWPEKKKKKAKHCKNIDSS